MMSRRGAHGAVSLTHLQQWQWCRSRGRPGKAGKAGRKASKAADAKPGSDDERGSGDDSDGDDEDFLVRVVLGSGSQLVPSHSADLLRTVGFLAVRSPMAART